MVPSHSATACAHRLTASEPAVLGAYRARLEALASPLVRDPVTWEEAAAGARAVLSKVAAVLANLDLAPVGHIRASGEEMRAVTRMAERRGRTGIAPAHSVRAADVLFEIVAGTLIAIDRDGAADRDLDDTVPAHHDAALVALAHALNDRLEAGVEGYDVFLLGHVKRLHDDERRALARDVHDRIGNTVALIMRRLEFAAAVAPRPDLDEICSLMTESLVEIGELVGELRRDDDFRGLHLALNAMVESFGADRPDIAVSVTGSEAWAQPAQVEVVFLVVREAVRNALAHSRAAHVTVTVDINPVEVRAAVTDDGIGLTDRVAARGHGHGVGSMRERVAGAGGLFDLRNSRHGGTTMAVRVPARSPDDPAGDPADTTGEFGPAIGTEA